MISHDHGKGLEQSTDHDAQTTGTSDAALDRRLDLSIIIPTLNEVENIRPLLDRLTDALQGIVWEAIFVDDNSRDGTSDLIREIGITNPRIRVVQRVGRRGLSSAVVEGMLAASAPILAVIDADMQHDERALPEMFRRVSEQGYDLAIGTRYAEGGSVGDWSESRERISRFATRLSALVLKADVKDPMSGFFVISRPVLVDALPRLSNIGFKVLMDLIASSSRPLKIAEVPYVFRNRLAGESKLDARVAQEFVVLLLEKMFGRFVPVRFLLFAFVGGLGVFVHLSVLWLSLRGVHLEFRYSQALAVFTAMTFNFFLNNNLTYRDMRLKGTALIRGLLSFYAVCLIGAVGNIGVGEIIYNMDYRWWLAGLAGAVVGVVWNYAVSAVFTWNKK